MSEKETITVLEAASLLRKSERTIYRYITAGKIAATLGPDGKYALSKQEIVERSKRQVVRQVVQTENILSSVQKKLDNVSILSRQLTAQQAQIDALEKELALLRERLEELTSQQRQQPLTPTTAPKIRSSEPRRVVTAETASTLPVGYRGFTEFFRDHGIPETTASRAANNGAFEILTDGWKLNGISVKKALDTDGQRAFCEHFAATGKLKQCSNQDCPCREYAPGRLF